MNDRRDELVRRAAELRAESAALITVSEELAGRLAERKQAGDQAMEQPEEQEPYAGIRGACPASPGLERASALPASSASRRPGAPGGENAGEAPVPQPGAGLLDEDEALVLAGVLEELAARHRPDPLSGPVLRRYCGGGWPPGSSRIPGNNRIPGSDGAARRSGVRPVIPGMTPPTTAMTTPHNVTAWLVTVMTGRRNAICRPTPLMSRPGPPSSGYATGSGTPSCAARLPPGRTWPVTAKIARPCGRCWRRPVHPG